MSSPARIGRYRITGELGRGAMGTVYRAVDETLDREIALKVMSAGAADPDARARFAREAKAAARLAHPNIVVVYELGEHQGAPFMALELLEGTDLQRAIEEGVRPDPRATLPLVLQLLAGLGYAHEHGIVHRDVKPSNVFLPLGRPAKVMDFGVARLAGHGTTTAGTIVGTPNYMSPEQVAGSGELDGRSDLFSTALILYELVTGERAIAADSVVVAMYKIAHETPDLSRIPAGSSWEKLRAVLDRGLARDREARYATAAAMSADLAAALVDLGGTPDLGAAADQALLVRRRTGTTGSVAVVTPVPGARPATAAPGEPPSAPLVERRAMPLPPRLRPAPAPAAKRSRAWLAVVPVVVGLAGTGFLLMRGGAPGSGDASPSPSAAAEGATPEPPPAAATPAVGPTSAPSTAAPAASPPAATTAAPEKRAASPVEAPAAASPSPEAPAAGLGPGARVARGRELLAQGRFREALAEAHAALDRAPTDAEAQALAQEAEAEVVLEECLRNAREALKEGDRDRALAELRRGFFIRKNDPRLLALHREVVRQ
jgi:tetratricopeptide (TPR) repeat protein